MARTAEVSDTLLVFENGNDCPEMTLCVATFTHERESQALAFLAAQLSLRTLACEFIHNTFSI